MPQGIVNTPDSFWARMKRVGPCLEWQGKRDRFGYGMVSFNGPRWKTHRLAWTLRYGPIPAGLFVCHTCDNPPCCEPLHMFLGTNEDNQRDSFAKGAQVNQGEAHPSARLTALQVRDIRTLASQGVPASVLAKRYGVHPNHVRSILTRRKWASLA